MKNFLSLFIILCLPMIFISCESKDDNPEPILLESSLIGYWYTSSSDIYIAYHIMEGGYGVCLYGEPENPSINEQYSCHWDVKRIDLHKIISVDSSKLILDDVWDVNIKANFQRISQEQWNNLKKTASLDGKGNSTPDDPVEPNPSDELKSSDFIGAWQYVGAVFNFKSSGELDVYFLKDFDSYVYSKKETGTWNFNSTTSQLKVYFGKDSDNFYVIEHKAKNYFKTKNKLIRIIFKPMGLQKLITGQ